MLAIRERISPRTSLFSDHSFEEFFGSLAHSKLTECTAHERLTEDETSFQIELELPGIQQNELEIQIQENRVMVAVKPSKDRATKHRFQEFKRNFRFRTPLNADAAEASLSHGILTIRLPKAASAVPRTLTINTDQ